MRRPRPRRLLVVAIVVMVAALSAWRLGWGVTDADRGWANVRRADLALEVEISGTLQADESIRVGPPPVPNIWQFTIANLPEEGIEVKQGDPLLTFDTSELQRELREKQAEMDSAAKQVEKEQTSLVMQVRDDTLALEDARARHKKTTLQLEVPEILQKSLELAKLRIDHELSARELEYLETRLVSRRRAGDAAVEYYGDKRDRAAARVEEMNAAVEAMTVTAPRDGIVVLLAEDGEEKKKLGDRCWVGDKILELPDLENMHAAGEVAEAEAGRIRVGLPVRLTLDAHTDLALTGQVDMIHRIVKRQAVDVPLKVMRVDVGLSTTDPRRMRPGMRFRGWIETDRRNDVLQIPAEAVFPTVDGPVAYVRTSLGLRPVGIEIGLRTKRGVEIVGGLSEGDEVATIRPEGRS